MACQRIDVLVVGAGQAGLGTAYWLARRTDLTVRVLDGGELGDTWRQRWDSLTLFTPRRFSGLPGTPFPPGSGYPTRLEMAAYLQDYARRWDLPVHTGVRVTALRQDGDGFVATTGGGDVWARQVVIAAGPYGVPVVPEPAARLAPEVWQLHSSDYRSPVQVPVGPVLVVGGGNSAAQLAVELAASHEVTVVCPREPWYLAERYLGISLYWWIYLTGILNAGARARVSRYVRARGDVIVGKQLQQLVRAGRVRLHAQRLVQANGMAVQLADGTELPVSSVLWCTGFRPDTSWLDVTGAVDEHGVPMHDRGASPVPGLHWMGLPWQTRMNSGIIDGVDRDARRTVRRIRALCATARRGRQQ